MKHTFFIIFIALMLAGNLVFCQTNRIIDSLKKEVHHVQNDSLKATLLREISRKYNNLDSKKAIQYGDSARRLADKINSKFLQAKSRQSLGIAFMYAGRLDSSIWYYKQTISIAEKAGLQEIVSDNYLNLGISLSYQGNYDAALREYYKSLELAEKHNLSKAFIYGSIAQVHNALRHHKLAADNYKLAIEDADQRRSINDRMLLLGNYANCLKLLNKFAEAKQILLECIDYRKARNDKFFLSNHYIALGEIYEMEENFAEAYNYYNHALSLKREAKSWLDVADTYKLLGRVEFSRKNITAAKASVLISFNMADTLKNLEAKHAASELLAKIAIFQHDLATAKYYERISTALKDSLNLGEQNKAIAEMKEKFETEKKEKENEALKLDQLKQETELSSQRYIILMIAIILVAVIVLLVVVFRSRQLFIRANALLKGKNEAIGIQHKEIASQKQQIDQQMEELKMTQSQLVHSEKMASLGQLMAGIAHELNNPLTFISAGTQALKDHISDVKSHTALNQKELWQEIEDLFTAVLAGVDRATRIVHSLRTFSYENSEGVQQADLIQCIEATLTMLQSEIKNKIEIQKNYLPLPLVECNAGEISQVLMNVLTNAIHAVGDKGNISIATGTVNEEEKIFISIKDSGNGIPDEVIKRIFDPFFTTKPLGKGVGLGLSISYKIIEQHNGSIEAFSKPGKGAEFIIKLPIHSLS